MNYNKIISSIKVTFRFRRTLSAEARHSFCEANPADAKAMAGKGGSGGI